MKKLVHRPDSLRETVREYLGQKNHREVERLLGRTTQAPAKSKNGASLRAPKYWRKWETELLGNFSDAEVARRTGRPYASIRDKREKLGFLYVLQRDWPEKERNLLGRFSDRDVARKTQRTLAAVQTKRLKLKIPAFGHHQRDWSKAEDALWGTASDQMIARQLGRSYASVQHRRPRLGIRRPNPLACPWTKLEDSLLGVLPDALLARHLNRTLAAVQFRRCDRKIPFCKCLPERLAAVIKKLSPILSQIQAERKRFLTITANPGRYRRRGKEATPRKQRWWTAAEDKLLGKFSDQTLARRLHRTVISVMRRRLRLGIFVPGQAVPWTTTEDALLGTMSDLELATKINRSKIAVKARRALNEIASWLP